MENELISVIIPMFNVEPYIEKCVRSVLDGDYQNIEILCIDDGSTDNTLSVVRKLRDRDSRISVFTQANAGVSAARNRGLKEAHGAYIAFIDADDWVTRDYLSTMFDIATEKKADIINCGMFGVTRFIPDLMFLDDNEYQIVEIPEKDKNRELINHVWRALYRRDICPLFNETVKIGEDQIFNIRILSEHREIIVWKCTKRMYIHYWRSDSLFSSAGIDRSGRIALDILNELDTLPVKKYAIIGAIRLSLGFRYNIESSSFRDKYRMQAAALLKKAAVLMLKSREIPFLEKAVYLTLVCWPWLYRKHRKNTV